MLVATFNINNVNRRLHNLLEWLAFRRPDIVCLQELKAPQDRFPEEAISRLGYQSVWIGQKSWNGVAILSLGSEPILIRDRLPGRGNDDQARYIEAAVKGILIANIYAPNGNPQPGPKFDYKLAWLERLSRHVTSLRKTGAPVALLGDFNVAPTEFDIYPTRSWDKDALVHPASRAAFRRLLGRSWVDAVRELRPDERIYTFWDYKRNRWGRDAGLRLDHVLLDRVLAQRLTEVGVDKSVRGMEGASDHAPVWVRLSAALEEHR